MILLRGRRRDGMSARYWSDLWLKFRVEFVVLANYGYELR